MNKPPDVLRIYLTFAIATLGIAAVLVAFLVAVSMFASSDNPGEVIAAVLSPVTALVGTLAGYVAGQAAGAAGKERAEARAQGAQEQLQAVLDVSPADSLAEAKRRHSDVFGIISEPAVAEEGPADARTATTTPRAPTVGGPGARVGPTPGASTSG